MDTSEQYIDMCNCPEIQEQWRPTDGDWFTPKYNIGSTDNWDNSEWIRVDDGDMLKKGETYCSGDFAGFADTGLEDFRSSMRDKSMVIWLPTQSELQEMVLDDERRLGVLLDAFVHHCFAITASNIDDSSYIQESWRSKVPCDLMEQLWIGFAMKEKHGKLWNGKKWTPKLDV